jgi:hypothetical protein
MVAKINSGSSLYDALSYNQEKVNQKHAKVIFTNRMIEKKNGVYGIGACMRSFEPYLLANRKTEKPVLHISINPDPKDVLTDEQLSSVAQQYMDKMGYGNQPFIVYKHEDIDRRHIHIVSLRVDENGRKLNHNFERKRSMDICRGLEREYSLVAADKKQRQESTPLKAVRYGDGDIKHQIAGVIRPIADNYHFQSLKQYKALLFFYNINVEEVRGEVRGKPYKGLVYSALNDKGEKAGNPFRASLFGKSVGIDALEKRMEKSAEIIKSKGLKERSRKVIASAMKSHPDRSSFEKTLAKNSIGVLFRENEQGRIYGATFIDHEQRAVFNGSHLGKEFSANVFNGLFGGKQHELEEKQIKNDTWQAFEPLGDSHQKDSDSATGGLFDLLSPEPQGVNPEEEAFAWRMRKKKRKRKPL